MERLSTMWCDNHKGVDLKVELKDGNAQNLGKIKRNWKDRIYTKNLEHYQEMQLK